MKVSIVIFVALYVLINADLSFASDVFGAANFLIQAQELSNTLQSSNSNDAIECGNYTNIELQRLSDAIQRFRTGVFALVQGLSDPNLPTPDQLQPSKA